jgi:hypothetical protein
MQTLFSRCTVATACEKLNALLPEYNARSLPPGFLPGRDRAFTLASSASDKTSEERVDCFADRRPLWALGLQSQWLAASPLISPRPSRQVQACHNHRFGLVT